MPTPRFYNLPQQKQDHIKNAIVGELLRVPYERVSINQIIREAGISRGSFYTYFQDKRDALIYILWEIRDDLWSRCRNSLDKSGGDFFAMLEDMLVWNIHHCEERGYNQIGEKTHGNAALARIFYDSLTPTEQIWEGIYQRMNLKGMRPATSEELLTLTRIGMEFLDMILYEYFNGYITQEEAVQSLKQKMYLIRYGVMEPAEHSA